MLLTDFLNLLYKIQRVPALQVEAPCFHVRRQLHSLWHCVDSPGHSLKLMSYRYCFHPRHQSHCHHFLHCLGQVTLSYLFSPCHNILPVPGSPIAWILILWISEIYGLFWEYKLFFLLKIQTQKHQSTSFHIVHNVFNMPGILQCPSCHKCFPTMTLKCEKIWNQRQLCVKVVTYKYKRKLENGCKPLLFFS